MFKNFLITSLRNLTRNRFYAVMNILGLSVGMACSLLILIYVHFELSYDKQFSDHHRIFRLETKYQIGDDAGHLAATAFPLGKALKADYPAIETYTRLFTRTNMVFETTTQNIVQKDAYYSDSTFFEVFPYDFIHGQASGALSEPQTAVLTASLQQKYFGEKNPVGEIIQIDKRPFKITGVINDPPLNTHVRFAALLSIYSLGDTVANIITTNAFWNINSNYTYIKLREDASISELFDNLEPFYEKYFRNSPLGTDASFELDATPLAKTHFNKHINDFNPTASLDYIWVLAVVGFMLLIIASINYMNMATARATQRSKEVGVRKAAGATRGQLIGQFLFESGFITLIALAISLLIMELLLIPFNTLADRQFNLAYLINPEVASLIIATCLFTAFVSGSYPAFYLSSFKPVNVLKGVRESGRKAGFLRKILVVSQFAISIFLISGTLVVGQQIRFMKEKPLGFNKDNVLVLFVADRPTRMQLHQFENTLKEDPQILATGKTTTMPGTEYNKTIILLETEEKMAETGMLFTILDVGMMELLGFEVIQGRTFDSHQKTDFTEAFIFNETTVKTFGWGEKAIGKKVHFGLDFDGNAAFKGQVVGIIKDYHLLSLDNKIEPSMLVVRESDFGRFGFLAIQYQEGKQQQVLEYVKQEWGKFCPSHPIDYYFLDDHLKEAYISHEKLGRIFAWFSIICLFISFLGLLGLASFVAEQKTKEVGIRKVLGASEKGIVQMFLKEFGILMLAAIIISAPFSWLALEKWLSGFAYTIPMSIAPILFSGGIAVLIAMLTVSYHALKAARSNPINALKFE